MQADRSDTALSHNANGTSGMRRLACAGDRRLKILHVVPTFFPATYWGGPIFSTKAICDGISALPGYELSVLTTDSAGPFRNQSVRSNEMIDQGYAVQYCRRSMGHSISLEMLMRLPRAIARADVVHLTSTFSFPVLPVLALAQLIGRPVVWSPRGAIQAMLEWPDSPNRNIKMTFLRVAQVLRPKSGRCVMHVTSPKEAEMSAQLIPGIETITIPNSVDIPPAESLTRLHDHDGTRLMFLSRLHPKKGLERLFDALRKLPKRYTLDIYGTGEVDYMRKVAALADTFEGRVRMHGHVEGEDKTRAFANADIFVFPSHSENFAIVIGEALAHGVPVITTSGTPWEELRNRGCGMSIDLETTDLAATILDMSSQNLVEMGRRGRSWIASEFTVQAMAKAFDDLYSQLGAGKYSTSAIQSRRNL